MVGNKVARMISGRRTDYGTTAAENRAALAFFLDRAARARLLFDGRRLQDVRMRSYRAAPIVVATAAGHPSAVALLLRYGVAGSDARAAIAYLRDAAAAAAAAPAGRPLAANAQSCLRLLLRAVPREDRADRKPPLLLHLARCAVREVLHRDFLLPRGIRLLPVPRSLASYLELEC